MNKPYKNKPKHINMYENLETLSASRKRRRKKQELTIQDIEEELHQLKELPVPPHIDHKDIKTSAEHFRIEERPAYFTEKKPSFFAILRTFIISLFTRK